MLCELHISNIAIIDELRIEFGEGLHILSGETGAGKSIILGAFSLVLGGRGDIGLLREGAEEARVEAHFLLSDAPWMTQTLEDVGLTPEPELIIRRTLSRSGRNRVHVNGSPVTVGTLKRLARGLVDFSSQHEQQILLDAARHLDILDDFGGHGPLLSQMAEAAARLSEASGRLKALDDRVAERGEREAFLRFQLAELERVNALPGEDDELEAERKRLAHSVKLLSNAEGAEAALYSAQGAAVEGLDKALKMVRAIAEIDPETLEIVEILESAMAQVEDAAGSLGRYARQVDSNPERLEEIEARLDVLAAIKRKYRMTLEELAERQREMVDELGVFENADDQRAALEQARALALEAAAAVAQVLSERRRMAAVRLEEAVQSELASLNMAAARFEVRVEDREGDAFSRISAKGWDRAAFYLAANPGEPAGSLSKVASGGELSRILLALKCALAGAGDVGTFIFDEIDTGIGGATAEVVGQKLRQVSRRRQVISITHLPQIAAYGQHHFNVVKEIVGKRTQTRVEVLDPQRRVDELARMLGGLRITQTTRDHALELMERGRGNP